MDKKDMKQELVMKAGESLQNERDPITLLHGWHYLFGRESLVTVYDRERKITRGIVPVEAIRLLQEKKVKVLCWRDPEDQTKPLFVLGEI